tara:strand:+ start:1609 stop:3381 length:1773 start_codon:yes stop_codon:yes gene_type:complete
MKKIKNNPILNTLQLLKYFNRKLKIRFLILSILIIFNSLTELLSISAIIPFLFALTNPEKINKNVFLSFFSEYLDLSNTNMVVFYSILFAIFILFSTFLKLLTVKITCNFCAFSANYLASKGYKNYINQNYKFYLTNKSSDFINTLSIELIKAQNSLESLFVILSATILSIFILISLIFINPELTFIIFLSILIIYLLIVKNIQSKLLRNSKNISRSNSNLIKMLQESFGGIREILINNNQNYFIKIFMEEDYFMRDRLETSKFYKKSPRYFIEASGVILLIITSLFVIVVQKNENIIPILGFIAFSFQKLLTSAQNIYGGWSSICSFNSSVLAVLETLNLVPKIYLKGELTPLKLHKRIVLRDIIYKHNNQNNPTLNGIDLTINKGEIIGIIGKTGSGKSTLLDIINGLLEPKSGDLIIDNKKIYKNSSDRYLKMWQNNVAHVPQNIFLSNDSIFKNIAFGIEENEIDESSVFEAAINACLADDIANMPLGYNTIVGERGCNLSGGQLQRLGIARALYRKKDLLILDEITSSLDKETENQIIDLLENFAINQTIIIIAHRLTTLKNCDKVFELKEGKLSQIEIKDIINN